MIITRQDLYVVRKLKTIADRAKDRKPLPKPKQKKTEFNYHNEFIN